MVERCCSAGARESSYPATDGEPTENSQVIWGPWTHSLGKEAERKHPEYYSTSNIKEQREREREREGNR